MDRKTDGATPADASVRLILSKRRKTFYDYGRHYHNDRFVGWRVWKVPIEKKPESDTVAEFFGPKARAHAQFFARIINQEKVG